MNGRRLRAPAHRLRGGPLNRLGLDGWTVHWDFAYGPARLREVAGRLRHPLLAADCYRADTEELAFEPSVVIPRGGIRVGVIGLAATIIDKTMPPHFSEGLRFTLGREELPRHILRPRRQEGADLVVVLSHLGFPQDCQLAADVAGIDVLLSGHTHHRTFEPARVGATTVIQSGSHGSFVGRLDLELTAGVVRVAGHRLIAVDDAVTPDPEMRALVERIVAPHRAMLGKVVGHTAAPLDRGTMLEATMDNLLLQAIAEAGGRRWRFPGYPKRCWGVTLHVKLENPPGRRIQHFTVGREPLARRRRYAAAFVTTQGVPARYGQERRDLEVHAVEALRRYLRRHPRATAELRGAVVVV